MPTKCSRQVSTATKGGQFRLDMAARLLSPAFATISGKAYTPSTYSSPPNTPTAVCMVLQSSNYLDSSQREQTQKIKN